MGQPTFIVTPGAGEIFRKDLFFSQAVRVGNRVELCGQGGWRSDLSIPSDLKEEYQQAFSNISQVLEASGASWDNVISINSYHVESIPHDYMLEAFKQYMPNHAPIYTCIGVPFLAQKEMRVEIQVTAVISS